MRLIIYEFKKIAFSKLTLVGAICILSIVAFSGIGDINNFKKQVGDVDIYNQLCEKYSGEIDLDLAMEIEKKVDDEYSRMFIDGVLDPNIPPEQRAEISFQINYLAASRRMNRWLKQQEDLLYSKSLGAVTKLPEDMEKEGQEDRRQYSINLKYLTMLNNVPKPAYANEKVWSLMISMMGGFLSIASISIMLLIAIVPIFSDEYKTAMHTVIFSTRTGQRRVATAKIIAAFMFTIIFVTLFYTIMSLIYLIGGKAIGLGDMQLNGLMDYEFTPFNLNASQTLLQTYLMVMLSSCTLSAIFCMISSTQRKTLSGISIALAFIILPFIGEQGGWIGRFFALFPSVALGNARFLGGFFSYSILGNIIMYHNVAIVICICILIVSIISTYKFYSNQIKK